MGSDANQARNQETNWCPNRPLTRHQWRSRTGFSPDPQANEIVEQALLNLERLQEMAANDSTVISERRSGPCMERRLVSFIGQFIRSDGHLGADLAHDGIDRGSNSEVLRAACSQAREIGRHDRGE
jgi:hypothetical protein